MGTSADDARDDLQVPRASLVYLLVEGPSLTLIACPYHAPLCLLYYPPPLPCRIDGRSLRQQFSVSLCRITLNLFFSLQRPLDPIPSLLQCVVSFRVLPAVRGRSCPTVIPFCTTPLRRYGPFLSFLSIFVLNRKCYYYHSPSSYHPPITDYVYDYYLMLFSFFCVATAVAVAVVQHIWT